MLNFKEEIAKTISKAIEIKSEELRESIEIPKEKSQGDYAFPCFRLAKVLRKSPQMIADDINSKIELDGNIIEKTEVAGGYLNFFVNKKALVNTVVQEMKERKWEYRKVEYWKWQKYSYRLFFT